METLDNYIRGECMEMCPAEEIKMRERESLLHVLEVVPGTEKDRRPKPDKNRMVKSFSRSAAGKSMQDPKNLRPPNVLLQTVNYLLNEVVCIEDMPWTVIYDFVMDRLRSVRQDMVIQNASRAHYITILQPIVRFHAYAAYRLCEESINNFDPVINNTHLQECLKRLLCMYDDCDGLNQSIGDAGGVFNDFLTECRPHFESLYIVLNLGSSYALTRGINLAKKWRTDLVETSLELSLAYSCNNFVRVCRIIKNLPMLLSAVASLHLPEIRRKAFQIMSVAYSSKNLKFPLDDLKTLLLYDSNRQLIDDCEYYGLEVRDNGLCFLKTSFNDKKTELPTHQQFMDEKLAEVDIATLLLFD